MEGITAERIMQVMSEIWSDKLADQGLKVTFRAIPKQKEGADG